MHVDHGKSALVKALTGTDPDRLPEEKQRQITIDLGFAELNLAGPDEQVLQLGIVDVPGHEDFVRNMHLPSAMLPSILDAVRNEKTDIYYQIGKAFLFAKLKRAGQG